MPAPVATKRFFHRIAPVLSTCLFSLGALSTVTCLLPRAASAQASPKFKVLCLGEVDSNHPLTGAAGIKAVQEIAAGQDYTVDAITDQAKLTDDFLAQYQVMINVMGWQGEWTAPEQAAVQKFVEAGKGWMGFHVSTLAGIESPAWTWYDTWVGGITFKAHPGTRQDGKVNLEAAALSHPVLQGLPASFTVHEEWYAWNSSPRGQPDITIMATVDESTYDPQGTAMGKDHPIMWSNTKYGPMVITSLGHEPEQFSNVNVRKFIANAIPWLAKSSATAVSPSLAVRPTVTPMLRWDGRRLLYETNPIAQGSGLSALDAMGRWQALSVPFR